MRRPGTLPLAASVSCFAIFLANVALGAFGTRAYLDDLAEMLTLFAAAIFFVAGVLARETEAGMPVREREDRREVS